MKRTINQARLIDEAFSALHIAVTAIINCRPPQSDKAAYAEWQNGLEQVQAVRDAYYAKTQEG